MDYEKIAHYGGYTKGSAQVLYRKAHRKLLDAFPVSDNQSMDNNTSDGAAPQTPKTPSAKGGKAGTNAGKKRKSAAAAENDDTPSTASSLSGGGDVTPGADGSGVAVDGEARTPTKTPAKRQRKSPVKKTAAVYVLLFSLSLLSEYVLLTFRFTQQTRAYQKGRAGFRRPERSHQVRATR